MTKSEALAEARRRWGPTAYIVRRITQNYRYEVGTAPYQNDKQGYSNKSWEAAFADADARLLAQSRIQAGEHMILTVKGWLPGKDKESCLRDGIDILDEENSPTK